MAASWLADNDKRMQAKANIQRWISVPLDQDIYTWYREKRQHQPVYFDQERGSWQVFRYADVQQVVMDHKTFSSQRRVDPENDIYAIGDNMLQLDPPRHHQLRALTSQGFTPRTIARLEPRIEDIVKNLLDQVEGRHEMDIIRDLSFPLPITVIAELLGVPLKDQQQFRDWSAIAVGPDLEARVNSYRAIASYFTQLIQERQQKPQDDLLSDLIRAEVDGEHLPDRDIMAFCYLLLVAGHETTTNLIGNAIVCLEEHPEAKQQLIEEPELLSTAIEEVLRYLSPVHNMARIATTDVVLAGQQIKAGDVVVPIFASANHDEEQFSDPETFNIRRTPNRHLSFGYGIHFCLGAPLARMEARIALQELLARFPHLSRKREIPLQIRSSNFIYGMEQIPVNL